MEALLGILILFAFFRALWNRKKGKTKRKKAYNTKTSKIKKRERKEKLKEQERLREIREEENFFKAVEKERKEIVRKEQALQREKLRLEKEIAKKKERLISQEELNELLIFLRTKYNNTELEEQENV